jgi:hypothetical protein
MACFMMNALLGLGCHLMAEYLSGLHEALDSVPSTEDGKTHPHLLE